MKVIELIEELQKRSPNAEILLKMGEDPEKKIVYADTTGICTGVLYLEVMDIKTIKREPDPDPCTLCSYDTHCKDCKCNPDREISHEGK
jgi:hypothetical protein